MRLSLGLILKDELGQFKRILNDYYQYFDEVIVAVDDKLPEFQDIAKDYPNVKILPYIWINDFSDKRNLVHKTITGEYYFRIDADDKILNPENIRKVAEDAKKKNLDIAYFYYLYSKDQFGNVNAAHWREGLIKNSNNLYWNKKIHENILPHDNKDYRIELNDNILIEHIADEGHIEQSVLRNIKYLLEEYEQDKENTDPRTLSYLGRMLHGIQQYEKAIYFLEKHIKLSGWDEDRYYSWCSLADCYRRLGNFPQATGAAFEALQERPDYPDAYLKLHDIYFDQDQWEKSYEWGKQGLLKPIPKTFLIQDPNSYTWLPLISMAHCLFEMNKFDEALKLLLEAKKQVPTLDYIVENEPHYRKAVEHKDFVSKLLFFVNYLKDKNEENKTPSLLSAVPNEFVQNEVVKKLRQYYFPTKVWGKDEVAIYCCGGAEKWSPKSVATGIGGSEEAVICLSKELSKLGYKVTVYNGCEDDEGIYDGVTYKNLIDFNAKDKFNILISWRANIFTYKIQARNKIIWLHDLPTNIDFTKDTVKTFDKIVVLSKYHASILPDIVPKEKVFVSTNGINPEDFAVIEEQREPHRVIYASSYNRGLEQLLGMWGDVKKEVPNATLHIYYGWDVYDKYVKQGWLKDDGFKAKMLKLFNQEGVYEHGRIGHKELLKEYAKSGVFAYPCTYAGEINCLAITKAIASGCFALTNEFAVCKERNIDLAVPEEQFKDRLIRVLKGEYTPHTNREKYIQENSWTSVAFDWSKNLFPLSIDIEIADRLPWTLAHFNKDQKIIDIGANKGHMFEGWDRKNITSIDIDKYNYEGFVQADATNMPFPEKSFDIALLAEIVEHTPDPVKVLTEALRVAKKVIITVPYEYEWVSYLKPFYSLKEHIKDEHKTSEELAKDANPEVIEFCNDNYEHLWHHTYYTPELLKEHLEKAGYKNFKIIKLRWQDWSWLGVETNG